MRVRRRSSAESRQVIPEVDQPQMQALREKWGPEWWIWRSRNEAREPNEWCATRRGRGGEVSRTLMEPTAELLEAALMLQADGSINE